MSLFKFCFFFFTKDSPPGLPPKAVVTSQTLATKHQLLANTG